jgi:hypothetical protein
MRVKDNRSKAEAEQGLARRLRTSLSENSEPKEGLESTTQRSSSQFCPQARN